jgi:hypothetical protein
MDQSSSPDSHPVIVGKPRRRWVKVDVDEEVFVSLHQKAAESRMRIQPYLRRFLAEGHSYGPGTQTAVSFSTDKRVSPQ